MKIVLTSEEPLKGSWTQLSLDHTLRTDCFRGYLGVLSMILYSAFEILRFHSIAYSVFDSNLLEAQEVPLHGLLKIFLDYILN